MKKPYKYFLSSLTCRIICLFCTAIISINGVMAQNDSSAPALKKDPYVKNTFNGNLLLENQTVMVPIKGTFEFVIQHKFGTIENGYDDFFGVFAPSNIRLGVNYVPIDKLQLGMGITKDRMQWDLNAKYALVKQAKSGGWPISITYYGNMAIDTRPAENFANNSDRLSYFNQLLIARKFSDAISLQVAPSLTYFNNVEGYIDEKGEIQPMMDNLHLAIAFMGKFRVSENMSILANYDQPLTEHYTNNPHPNLSIGLEISTSSHSFQIIFGNYYYILPQANNFYNQNDYKEGQFSIGFNIGRLWNF
jgi:Membrane bound beta barrel domain (DUF5777)